MLEKTAFSEQLALLSSRAFGVLTDYHWAVSGCGILRMWVRLYLSLGAIANHQQTNVSVVMNPHSCHCILRNVIGIFPEATDLGEGLGGSDR